MIKKIIYGVLALLIIATAIGFNYYQKIYSPAITEDTKIFVKSNSSLDEVKNSLKSVVANIDDFSFVVKLKKFQTPKAGMYTFSKDLSMNAVVNKLRSGNQTPVKVTFNNQDTLEKLAGRIAQQIEADSISILKAMTNEAFLRENDFTKKSALGMYIPNQYEAYWNTSAENFRDKMLLEYNRFWNKNRLAKASKLNLSEDQVITLASIVQKETAQKSERPTVAGLYLNRYKNNWPLQADPTVIYCIKLLKGQDFVVKRVLNKDLNIDSPYNTYKNTGLPPTLIAMPDISAIDAVLNAEQHNYYYMCASIDNIGYHDFAKTLAQHNRNAKKYQNWINNRGIKR